MATLPTPTPYPVPNTPYTLVAFYYPGREEPWDRIYKAPFLGNFWPASVTLAPPVGDTATFHVGEAAFQATKWWASPRRAEFEACRTGRCAYHLARDHRPTADYGYAGFHRSGPGIASGDEAREGAMWAVLTSKFEDPALRAGLLATGEAYLLEHASNAHETYWSDGGSGGTNRLGIQLMDLREHLGGAGVPDGADDVSVFTDAVRSSPPAGGEPSPA